MNTTASKIKAFFSSSAYAVVGASNNRDKFGNKVLRCYMQHGKKVYPVNPNEETVEGIGCVDRISNLSSDVHSISIITPPAITERIVEQAFEKGIKNIWMQPGAESVSAVKQCETNGINVIAGGTCILVELGFDESI